MGVINLTGLIKYIQIDGEDYTIVWGRKKVYYDIKSGINPNQ